MLLSGIGGTIAMPLPAERLPPKEIVVLAPVTGSILAVSTPAAVPPVTIRSHSGDVPFLVDLLEK